MDTEHLIQRLIASGIPTPSDKDLDELQAWADRVVNDMVGAGVPIDWINRNLNLVPVMHSADTCDVFMAVGSMRFRIVRDGNQ